MKPRAASMLLFALVLFPPRTQAQSQTIQSPSRRPSPVRYSVTIEQGNHPSVLVEMRIARPPRELRLAMARHPEYNDNFWRQVRSVSIEADGKPVEVTREASAVWRAVLGSRIREARVRYQLEFPPQEGSSRRSWQPFLRETGGLLGGVQTYLYPVGSTRVPAQVHLQIPADWQIATGLEPTADPHVFSAASIDELLDSPVVLGALRTWEFVGGGRTHRVAYWPLPDAAPFDAEAFVDGVKRIVLAAIAAFGHPPYKSYVFLFQDGAGDALEHHNSLTLGIPSALLAKDPLNEAATLAHEFAHTWNLVYLRPRGWGATTYLPPARTKELWWSEGVTLYFADELLRRAGIRDEASARQALINSLGWYLGNPGNTRVSPEQASLASGDLPGVNGGYTASYYTQGELIGQILDLTIRDSTGLKRGLDDVLRALVKSLGGSRGFTGADIERTASQVCACKLHNFFEDYVRQAKRLPLEDSLAKLGFRVVLSRAVTSDEEGRPLPDLRISASPASEGSGLLLRISNPETVWAMSGLRSGDELLSVDSKPVKTPAEFHAALVGVKVDDRVAIEFRREGKTQRIEVTLKDYESTSVRLEDLPQLTPKQRALRRVWMTGIPSTPAGAAH